MLTTLYQHFSLRPTSQTCRSTGRTLAGSSQLLVIGLLSLLPWLSRAQCPIGDVVLSDQAQVDAFPAGCINLPGGLSIEGVGITSLLPLSSLQTIGSSGGDLTITGILALNNLSGLDNLTKVGGTVYVSSAFALRNLQGLGQLQSVGGLSINNNLNLNTLSGLQSLTVVGGTATIQNNPNLSSLQGLNQLQLAGALLINSNRIISNLTGLQSLTAVRGTVAIQNNPGISSLQGIDQLQSAGALSIDSNPALGSLSGLQKLKKVGGALIVNNNQVLTSLQALDQLQSTGELAITNNSILANLNGLQKLTAVDGPVSIGFNPIISSLQGLDQIQSAGALSISNNLALSSLSGLQKLMKIEGNVRIETNSTLSSLQGLDQLQSAGALYVYGNPALGSLNGLLKLTKVGGALIIDNNQVLTSLQALDQLRSIGELFITNSPKLTSLNGLQKLTAVDGPVSITYNPIISSLQGLDQLQSAGGVVIANNSGLGNLSGLQKLTSVKGYLRIFNNSTLTSLHGLDQLQSAGGLTINDNPQLSQCAIESICSLITTATARSISGNATGCSSEAEIQAECNPLTISTQPAATSSVCAGTSISTTVAVTGKAPLTYQWYKDNLNNPVADQTSATLTLNNVKTTDVGSYSAVITSGSVSITSTAFDLTVNALPNAGFSGLASTYCANANAVTLTPTTSGGTFSGPGVSGSAFNPAQAGTGSKTIRYSVMANGCANFSEQTITVNAIPDAGFSGPASTYCANASVVTLIPTTSGGTFTGPGVSGNSFNPAQAGTGTKTIRYSVTTNGCANFSEQIVTINPLPNAGFSGLASTYCINVNTVNLTPITSGGTFSGPGISGNSFNPSQAGIGSKTIRYSVTTTGCTNFSEQSVTVKSLPQDLSLTNNGPLSANNPSVTLTANSPTSGLTYAFSNGANQQPQSNKATVTTAGIFSVTATLDGCSATAATTVLGANSPFACRGTSATINLTASGSPIRYEWYLGVAVGSPLRDGAYYQGTTSASLRVVSVSQSQVYYAKAYYADGSSVTYGPFRVTLNPNCGARQTVEPGSILHITLLGNPVQDRTLRALVEGATGGTLLLELVNTAGQSVRVQSWEAPEATHPVNWSLAQAVSGTYVLQATSGQQRHSLRLIIP